MADTKISNLTALAAAPDSGDFVALVDTSASETKKLDAKYLVRDSGGSGAIVTGAYTLTLPADMTAAGLGIANVFTAAQRISGAGLGINVAATELIQAYGGGGNAFIFIYDGAGGNNTVHNAGLRFSTDNIAHNAYIKIYRGADSSNIGLQFVTRSYGADVDALRILPSSHLLINTTTDSAQLTVNQASSTAAQPVLHLTQADLSEGFIDFSGTSAASATGPISTWTTGNAVQGHFAVEINGTRRWVRFYDNPTS
jgi:hypothetical protein